MEMLNNLLDSSSAKGRFVSAIIIAATALILSFGISILNYIAGNNTTVSLLFCIIPIIISVFYLGASLHIALIESKIEKQERAELGELISERMFYLDSLINKGKLALKNFQTNTISDVNIHNENTHTAVLMIRRIVNVLENRIDQLVTLSTNSNYRQAEELSFSPLQFLSSSVTSVGNKEMPTLSHDQWETALDNLIQSLEFKKVA